MKKYIGVLILFLFLGLAYADERFDLSGYLKNETSLRINEENFDLTKFKNIAELAAQYKIKDDELVFFGKVKYWYDSVYDWRRKLDAAQHEMGHIQRTDWLRDCYLDYIHGPWFLRLGKQQVAWGQADGITILDRVNPVDLTEYWLQDFVDMRIPLWMANINYAPKLNSNIQLLIIPDFEQSTAAPGDAPFAFRSYKEFEIYKKRKRDLAGSRADTDIYYPGKQFKNSTFALQWSDRVGDLNYTLNYLNGYYYSARTYLLSSGATASSTSPLVAHYGRIFKRWRMYGGSLNKSFTKPGPLQGITLRGDFAYYDDEPTYYGNILTASSSGVNRWDNIFWLMGIDKEVISNWLASFQFAQYIMQHSKCGYAYPNEVMNAYTYGPQDRVENIFTLKVSTDFLHQRLKPEVLWSFTDDNQGRLSPKVTYEIKDNLFFTVGVHYFYGNAWDSNGQFRDENQFYTQLKYTF
jgi:hypothetical protein